MGLTKNVEKNMHFCGVFIDLAHEHGGGCWRTRSRKIGTSVLSEKWNKSHCAPFLLGNFHHKMSIKSGFV